MPSAYESKSLTERDEMLLGIKKEAELPRTVLVAYPKRYSSSAVAWVSEWVNEKEYERMQSRTNVQEIKRKGKK